MRLPLAPLFALALMTAPAHGTVVAPAPTVPARELRAGETVELRWGALPDGVREFEVMLSLDGGRTWPLRVSAELDRSERCLRWRVPEVATQHARLMLRCGDEVREMDGAPSAPFAILVAPGRVRLPAALRGGTWWNGSDETPLPRARTLGAPGIGDAGHAAPAWVPPRHAPAHVTTAPPRLAGDRPPPTGRAASFPPDRGRAPLDVPMRS
jgi:hypothetical protein